MIDITKDQLGAKKRFKCRRCHCVFISGYLPCEHPWSKVIPCPVCGRKQGWTDGMAYRQFTPSEFAIRAKNPVIVLSNGSAYLLTGKGRDEEKRYIQGYLLRVNPDELSHVFFPNGTYARI